MRWSRGPAAPIVAHRRTGSSLPSSPTRPPTAAPTAETRTPGPAVRHRSSTLFLLLAVAATGLGAVAGAGTPAGGGTPAAPNTTDDAFAGEDVLEGGPWHHEDITRRAARRLGFEAGAERSVAWHADYVDSYLYNPLWWLDLTEEGGPRRVRVSLATRDQLARVHFDDLFEADEVEAAWRRYVSGTLAGLVWAAERNDVAAAHNVLGVSLHAIQDFYSHSNWLDSEARVDATWFSVSGGRRRGAPLWTGSYELAEHLGVQPHGKYAPSCSVLSRPGLDALFDEGLCHAASPLSSRPICRKARACAEGEEVTLSVGGVELPENVVYMAPPGIALDNSWMAGIGGWKRGMLDSLGRWEAGAERVYGLDPSVCRGLLGTGEACETPGDHLFGRAKALAILASVQWLELLEEAMRRTGHSAFWGRVVSEDSWDRRYRQYEGYDRFPYQFLSAGPYPRGNADGYYLRLELETSGERRSGTDADVRAVAGGQSFLLDYLPGERPLLAHNDFEAGDAAAYTIGPFDRMPGHLILENDAADAREVIRTMAENFRERLASLGPRIRRAFRSFLFGRADYVGEGRKLWSTGELMAIGTTPEGFTIDVDGGSEGRFRVHGTIRATAGVSGRSSAEGGWREFEVRLGTLECVEESEWDRGTRQDEPFVLSALASFGETTHSGLFGPWEGVDSGEVRAIGHRYERVRVSGSHGMLSLAVSVMESDRENADDRERLLEEFATAAEADEEERERLREVTGRAVAADWKLSAIEVTAFHRGERIEVGRVLHETAGRWIEGGGRARFELDESAVRRLPVRASDLQRYRPRGTEAVTMADVLEAADSELEMPGEPGGGGPAGPDLPDLELPDDEPTGRLPLTRRRGLGFAWVHRPEADRSAPSERYAFNGAGGAIRVERGAPGRYEVVFDGLGTAARGGHLQVTAYDGAHRSCRVADWGSVGGALRADVACDGPKGAGRDGRFVVQALAPGVAHEGLGFAWANRPRTRSYRPSEAHAYNGAGDGVRIERTARGRYRVRFEGLGSDGGGGHVQVTAFGGRPGHCKVVRWSSAGDLAADVACFAPSGRPRDRRFLIQAWAPGTGPRWMAYAWADRPRTSGRYEPSGPYARNGAGGEIEARRLGVGSYAVRFADLGGADAVGGSVQVTAYGPGPASCRVQRWASRGPDLSVRVRCHAPGGRPADSRFTVQALGVAAGSRGLEMPRREPRRDLPLPVDPPR